MAKNDKDDEIIVTIMYNNGHLWSLLTLIYINNEVFELSLKKYIYVMIITLCLKCCVITVMY